MIDFVFDVAFQMHRVLILEIEMVCENEIELNFKNDEQRIFRFENIFIIHDVMHKWRNTFSEKVARMFFMLLNVKPITVNGKVLEFEIRKLLKEYVEYAEGKDTNKKI